MPTTMIGDFADPLSFLASQRVEQITSLGLHEVHWIAVEADRLRPVSGELLSPEQAAAARELALPAETVPAPDVRVPNSRAATAAYAESLTDGMGPQMRRALFDALWVRHQAIGDPETIRRLVYELYNRPLRRSEIEERRRRNQPLVSKADPDVIKVTRLQGLIVSMGRGPLTTAGQRRIDQWRRTWQQRGCAQLPLLLSDLGEPFHGPAALQWLAERLPHSATSVPADRPIRSALAG